MTDPESDELYDELRRKLANYGSQPSDAVWAGIRQRVPARPAPRLRPRTYRRMGALLGLLLLLTAALVAGVYYRTLAPQAPVAVAPQHPAAPAQTPPAPSRPLAAATPPASPQRAQASVAGAPVESGALPSAASTAVVAASSAQPLTPGKSVAAGYGRTPRPARRSRAGAQRTLGASGARSAALATPAYAAETRPGLAPVSTAAAATLTSGTGSTLPAGLLARPVTLPLSLPALPEVQAGAETGSAAPAYSPPYRRLAVQVVAGPAITYRRLNARGDSATRRIEALERPATGYMAQVGVTYALTPRVTVLGGLGYAEYATDYDLTLRTTTTSYTTFTRPVLVYRGSAPDTLFVRDTTASRVVSREQRLVRNRDVYRFVTVPVQLQYRVAASGRLSYDFLLGSTLSLYTGGRTTQVGGDECNCQQTTWRGGDSPFRVASLGVMAGAGINYRLLGRWSLNLQHHFTYLLTPLSAARDQTNRHLFSAGLRAGFTFDLR